MAALAAVWLVATRHGPFSADSVNDLYVYGVYHQLLEAGLAPYREFAFEYPPGALLPIWAGGGHDDRFSLLMLGCALVAQGAAWALGGWRAGWALVALPVVAGALVRTHFDALPAALALVGLALIARPRFAYATEVGFLVLALGTITKLWPGLIAAVALCWLWGRGDRATALRSLTAFAAVVLAIALPFAAGGGFPGPMVRFHLDRPVQIESTAATVLEIAGGSRVTGDPIRHDDYKSNGLDGGAASLVNVLSTLAGALTALAILALAARRPSRDALVLASLAITLAFVVFGKVLSPQYLVWLLPLAAVVAGRRHHVAPALVAAAALTTQLYFPGHYFDVVFQHAWAVVAVGVRNALLLLALAATARALARSPSPAAGSPRSG